MRELQVLDDDDGLDDVALTVQGSETLPLALRID
jgi:hypothetical protein